MNKTDLIDAVAMETGFTKKDSEKAVSAVFDIITKTLAEGEKVSLVGFGSFEVRERAARKYRVPRTDKEVTAPASKVPAFRAGKNLKKQVDA